MPGSAGYWNGPYRRACSSLPPPLTSLVCKPGSILLQVVLLGQIKSRNGDDTDGPLENIVLVRVYYSSNVILHLVYLLT